MGQDLRRFRGPARRDHLRGLCPAVARLGRGAAARPEPGGTWPRPGPARSTGSGRGASRASCATASAAPPRPAPSSPRATACAGVRRCWCARSWSTTSAWWRARWPTSAGDAPYRPRATAGPTRCAPPPPAPTSSSTAPRRTPISRRRLPASTGSPPPPARQRCLAKTVLTPEQDCRPSSRRRFAEGLYLRHRVGAERNGLKTDEVANADAIADRARQPELRLAQPRSAVLLIAYEWLKQAGGGTRWVASPPTRRPSSRVSTPAVCCGGARGPYRFLRADRARARCQRLLHGAGQAAERGPEPALHVRGARRATEQEIRTLCGRSSRRWPIPRDRSRARLSHAAFSPWSDATSKCRHGHQNARGRQHGASLMKGGSRCST